MVKPLYADVEEDPGAETEQPESSGENMSDVVLPQLDEQIETLQVVIIAGIYDFFMKNIFPPGFSYAFLGVCPQEKKL